jgi:putative DNA primase/helicase
VIVASNEALTTTDYSSGLERRRVTVPFEKRITEEEKERWNKHGGEAQLRAEIPGLVNWLLDMPIEEMEYIIAHPPARVINANTEAMRDSNPVADWAMENCIPSSGTWTRVGIKEEVKDMGGTFFLNEKEHLYPNYLRWCLQSGREPLSLRRFSSKVVDILKNVLMTEVLKTRRGGGFGLQGIQLKNENEPVHEWLKNGQV